MSIILNSFSSRELSFLDPVHELPWIISLVGDFIDLIIKELSFCFLDSFSEFLPIIQTFWMSVYVKISATIIVPPGFGIPCNIDFFRVLMPYIADIYSKRVDNFFKNIDINNRISLEVFYEIFQFGNKSIFLLTILNKNTLQYPNLFLDYKNVDSDGSMIRGRSPIRVDMVGIKFCWFRTELESWSLSEYLVGKFSVGLESSRWKESTILNKISLKEEWNRKLGSQRQSLILKLPIIRRILFKSTSVSLRYIK